MEVRRNGFLFAQPIRQDNQSKSMIDSANWADGDETSILATKVTRQLLYNRHASGELR